VRIVGSDPLSLDNPEHLTFTDLNPFHEVQTAFYSASRRGICNFEPATESDELSSRTVPGVRILTDSAALRILIGAKDDLTFGFLIGPPIFGILQPAIK